MPHQVNHTVDALRWWRASPGCLISQGSCFHSIAAAERLKSWYFQCRQVSLLGVSGRAPSQGVGCPGCPTASPWPVLWALLCSDLLGWCCFPFCDSQGSRVMINYWTLPEILEECFYLFEQEGWQSLMKASAGLCRGTNQCGSGERLLSYTEDWERQNLWV